MKTPRNLSGSELTKNLEKLGYVVVRQKGSHVRLTTLQNGEHHLTIPAHNPIKVGTLAEILKDVADHFGLQREELLEQLFG